MLNIYTIKISVHGVSLMMWHRLRFSGSISYTQLHHIIQIAMGWDDDHLHIFRFYGKEYGIYYPGGKLYSDDPDDIRIDQFEFEPGNRIIDTYNFIDNHVHDNRVHGELLIIAGNQRFG